MSLEQFKSMVAASDNIVFFGGAGVSTESNIPDFRSSTGLYNTKTDTSYPPEVMLSHTFFMKHTEEFYKFYKNTLIYKDAKPNAAHKALAELERRGKLKAVITQNIDGLHQMAGSKKVLELHGSTHRNFCMKCGKAFSLDDVINSEETVPRCNICGGIIKPDVVLYEETLDADVLNEAIRLVAQADILIVGGTSLVVYPAAGLIQYYHNNKLILINRDETPYDQKACLVFHDSIGRVLDYVL